MIFGLMDAESFTSFREYSFRRRIFYQYPNGAATLTAILSLLKEESVNDPKFTWFEKRLAEQVTTLANISSTITLYSAVSADFGTWTAATGNFALTAASSSLNQYGIKVTSAAAFRANHTIRFNVIQDNASVVEVVARVTYSDTSNNRLAIQIISGTGAGRTADYDAANAGAQVQVIGSAYQEGAGTSTPGGYTTPTELNNYTQIFRTPWKMTGTALKVGAKFDKTGVYRDLAKEHSLNHMMELEKAFIFGRQTLYTDSDGNPVRTTKGIIPWLEDWESGSVYGNTAATALADDNKRIIDLSSASNTITDATYNTYLERIFRSGGNQANEKLVLCGSGFLKTMNTLYKNETTWNYNVPAEETYGMNVKAHMTPFGTVYYKTHPLFSQNATLRYAALFLDVNNLKYRYLDGRDTQLLKNRQNNGDDFRMDEWLSECGLEMIHPETHMFMLNAITAG